MEQENSKIEIIADRVQTILDKETKSASKVHELETRFNNLQNAIFSPSSGASCFGSDERRAFADYIRKGVESELVTKSLSTAAGEAQVAIVNELNKEIISAIHNKSVIRQLASIERISSSALDIIIEQDSFAAGWVGEAAERPETDTAKLVKKTIPVHELYAQPKATQKLLDDSALDINSWLGERLIDSFAGLENQAFINGDGVLKPTGILRNEGVQRIDTQGLEITTSFLLRMINSLPEEYIANSSFLMNRTTLAAIQNLKDENGRFIWQTSLSDSLKQSIFGIPVFCSSHMPNIANDSVAIVLGDFKKAYKIVDRSQIAIMRDPYTEKPFVKFYAVKRVGGDVVQPQALKFARFVEAAE